MCSHSLFSHTAGSSRHMARSPGSLWIPLDPSGSLWILPMDPQQPEKICSAAKQGQAGSWEWLWPFLCWDRGVGQEKGIGLSHLQSQDFTPNPGVLPHGIPARMRWGGKGSALRFHNSQNSPSFPPEFLPSLLLSFPPEFLPEFLPF